MTTTQKIVPVACAATCVIHAVAARRLGRKHPRQKPQAWRRASFTPPLQRSRCALCGTRHATVTTSADAAAAALSAAAVAGAVERRGLAVV